METFNQLKWARVEMVVLQHDSGDGKNNHPTWALECSMAKDERKINLDKKGEILLYCFAHPETSG